MVHSRAAVAEVLALRAEGLGARRIARRTALPLATVRDWLAGRVPRHSRPADPASPTAATCEQCGHDEHAFDQLPREYAYLFGLYLGDGCISRHVRDVYRLRVFLDLRYPSIIEECEAAIRAVLPRSRVNRMERTSNYTGRDEATHVEITAFSKTWPCLFPQHGRGRKHERPIVLAEWQQTIADRWPDQLLRGLIHSDGCRFINTGRGGWVCPRYSFSNLSDDIRAIFCEACDRLGVRWTKSCGHRIYVSRRDDVAFLDTFIGPKT